LGVLHLFSLVASIGKAIELDPRYVKAYFRRALANLAILKPKIALADFKKVVQLDPNNAAGRTQFESTQKLVRRMEFEKA
jgi:serine/threonine-protein phosphatase 5